MFFQKIKSKCLPTYTSQQWNDAYNFFMQIKYDSKILYPNKQATTQINLEYRSHF